MVSVLKGSQTHHVDVVLWVIVTLGFDARTSHHWQVQSTYISVAHEFSPMHHFLCTLVYLNCEQIHVTCTTTTHKFHSRILQHTYRYFYPLGRIDGHRSLRTYFLQLAITYASPMAQRLPAPDFMTYTEPLAFFQRRLMVTSP